MVRGILTIGVVALCVIGLSSAVSAAPKLSLNSVNIEQGHSGTLTLDLSSGTAPYAGVNATFDLPAGVSLVSVAAGPLTPGSFSIHSNKSLVSGKERVTVIAYSGTGAFSSQSGPLLSITVQAAPGAPLGSQTVSLATSGLSNGDGSISIPHSKGDGTITVAMGACSYTLTPDHDVAGPTAGTGKISVTTGDGCVWTALSNNGDWLSVTWPPNGSGNGTANYSYTANAGAARTGTITIAGKTFTLTQSGSSCTYMVEPDMLVYGYSSGNGSVNVTTQPGCSWSAVALVNWITITSGDSGTGNGSVGFSFSENMDVSTRKGEIIVEGQTATVMQSSYCARLPVKLIGSGNGEFSKLQTGFEAAVEGESTIQAQATVFTEALVLNVQKAIVTLSGGFDCEFTINDQSTILYGTLTIMNGTLIVEGLEIW